MNDDQISSQVAATEATYNADVATLQATQASIAAAGSPLAAQQAAVQTDIGNYVAALQARQAADAALITQLQAQVTTPLPPVVVGPPLN